MVCNTMSSNSPLYRALKLNMRQHGSWLKSLNSTSTKLSQVVILDGAHTVMEDNSMEKNSSSEFLPHWHYCFKSEAPDGFIEIDKQALPSAIEFVISLSVLIFVSIRVAEADF